MRTKRTFFLLSALIGIICVVIYVQYRHVLISPITKVKIESDFRFVSREEVAKLLLPFIRDGYFGANPVRIKKRLEQNHSIRHAAVSRLWPDTLKVFLTERIPILRFNDSKLVDDKGVIFDENNRTRFENLPAIVSDRQFSPELLQEYKKISKILGSVGLAVKKLSINQALLKLELVQDFVIVASYPNYQKELRRFADVYKTLVQEKTSHIVSIDLRYQHGMAVRWR